jgi:hypothetical protein
LFLFFDKDSLKTTACCWVIGFFVLAGPAWGQHIEPRGRYVQVGVATLPGLGLTVGSISARTLYTREVHIISNLQPAFRSTEDQINVAALVGFSVRVFGFERLVGNAGYRGFDVDLGLRAGPGLSFSSRDSKVDKNRRFVLLVDPIARISRASNAAIFFMEVGGATPSIRIGVWVSW